MKTEEELGEAAYDAMYHARPRQVKDLYDDACAHFGHAIVQAKETGRDEEVTRLTARLDHITQIYNHQFRGLGY
jgi:hypothetical protein